jgi:hypothetical protein
MTVEAGPFYLRSILLHDLSLSPYLTLPCIALHLDPLVLLVLSTPTPANTNSAAKKQFFRPRFGSPVASIIYHLSSFDLSRVASTSTSQTLIVSSLVITLTPLSSHPSPP